MTDFRTALTRLVDRWPEIELHEIVSALRDEADRREAMSGEPPALWHFNKVSRQNAAIAHMVELAQKLELP